MAASLLTRGKPHFHHLKQKFRKVRPDCRLGTKRLVPGNNSTRCLYLAFNTRISLGSCPPQRYQLALVPGLLQTDGIFGMDLLLVFYQCNLSSVQLFLMSLFSWMLVWLIITFGIKIENDRKG